MFTDLVCVDMYMSNGEWIGLCVYVCSGESTKRAGEQYEAKKKTHSQRKRKIYIQLRNCVYGIFVWLEEICAAVV